MAQILSGVGGSTKGALTSSPDDRKNFKFSPPLPEQHVTTCGKVETLETSRMIPQKLPLIIVAFLASFAVVYLPGCFALVSWWVST